MSIPINGVSHMLRRALNTLDYRLMDHGERVAYLVLCMCKADKRYSGQQLKEICYLSMFHDIGAYKTEIIDSLLDKDELLRFEISNSLSHSVYSYLFLKNFSFLNNYVDAILFHHFTYKRLLETDCGSKQLAERIFLADRIDIMISKGLAKTTGEIFEYLESPVFCPGEVQLLRKLEEREGCITKIMSFEYLDELLSFFNTRNLTEIQIASLATMLPYTIDFRSESTVTHTVATVEIAMALAQLFKLTQREEELLYYGSMLHDIGKISVSLSILEKQSALTSLEFDVMKDHVLLSEYILKGHVSDEVLLIAIRHHEKLDGSGYPYGIKGEDLTLPQRIVAVADIMSALLGKRSYKEPFAHEKVREIIGQMSAKGKICSRVADMVLENYGYIAERVEKCNKKAMDRYTQMTEEYNQLLEKYK